MDKTKTLESAKKHGYILVIVTIVTLTLQAYFSEAFSDNLMLFCIASSVGTLTIAYPYIRMLQGIEVIANESEDQFFILSTTRFIKITIIGTAVFVILIWSEWLLGEKMGSLLSLISTLGIMVYLGGTTLKISKGFLSLQPEYGKLAKQTSYWHKVSGYLMVSVILSIIGIVLSLVADYFMWKLICQRLKENGG